jgi:hypothetical protein
MKPATFIQSAAFLAALAIAGCNTHKPSAASAQSTPKNYPVIYSLISRTQTLTVTSGPDGPLYSVTDPKGVVLMPPSTLAQVAIIDPKLHQWVNSAVAASASISFD